MIFKKKVLISAAILLLIISAILFFIFKVKSFSQGKPSDTEITNLVPSINQRPYITMTPSVSPVSKAIDGKFFVFAIENIPSDYQVEYQILYTTSSNIQEGITGSVDTYPNYLREWFFGTKSTGDYRFHQGVEFGEVTTIFKSEKNEYDLVSDFRLQKIGPQKVSISDKDQNYSLELSAGAISKNSYIILHKTGGLPQKYSGVFLVDQPVGFFSQGIDTLAKNAKLKIKTDKNSSAKVVILGFDSAKKEWIEFETQFDPQTQIASADVNLLSSYIVVEKSTQTQ